MPLFGHDIAVAAFTGAYFAKRMHHAWLLSGPEGIGKATFAKAAGQWLVAQPSAETIAGSFDIDGRSQAARLIAAEAHPDYKLIEREVWKEGKGDQLKPKDERGDADQPARSIKIVQIRWLRALLANKPALSGWRAVIIDSIDDLERGAANALLKSLEEPPPNTLFLLVSHAPERLLPTIRSRCRQLRLAPLEPDAMRAAVAAVLPDLSPAEIEELTTTSGGAPGRAVAQHGLDVGALDRELDMLARDGDPANARRAALAQSLSLKTAQPRYEVFLARAPSRIAAAARERRGRDLADALRAYERAADLAAGAVQLSLDPFAVVFELAGLVAALSAPPRAAAG